MYIGVDINKQCTFIDNSFIFNKFCTNCIGIFYVYFLYVPRLRSGGPDFFPSCPTFLWSWQNFVLVTSSYCPFLTIKYIHRNIYFVFILNAAQIVLECFMCIFCMSSD